MEAFLRWAATTGPSFVPAWSNASVALVAFAVFAVFLVAGIWSQRQWILDVAFLALVAGGILVAWPAMVVLSIAAAMLLIVVSVLYRALAPARSAQIEADADRQAQAAVEAFAREMPGGEEALRAMRDGRRKEA